MSRIFKQLLTEPDELYVEIIISNIIYNTDNKNNNTLFKFHLRKLKSNSTNKTDRMHEATNDGHTAGQRKGRKSVSKNKLSE